MARVPAIVWIAAIALAALLIQTQPYPSYDYGFSIANGQAILDGHGPTYDLPYRTPSPHALTVLTGIIAAGVGDLTSPGVAYDLFILGALLALGLLVWSLFRLGQTLFAWPVGLLAGCVVFFSPAIFSLAARTYNDLVAAALVVFATLLEARRPRRGWPVLAVLVPAGLLRPEVWVLAGLYWLWLFPARSWPERAKLAALVVAAPLLYMLSDLLITGDPLYSSGHVQDFAETFDDGLTIDRIPTLLPNFLERLVGLPFLIGAAAGVAFGAWIAPRRIAVPVAVGVASLATQLALPLIGGTVTYFRFYVTPAAMLALLFGVGALGWLGVARGRRRTAWAVVGVVLMVAGLFGALDRAEDFRGKRVRLVRMAQYLDEQAAFMTAPAQRELLAEPACRPVTTQGFITRPYLRYAIGGAPTDVSFYTGADLPQRGTLLITTDRAVRELQIAQASNGRETRDAWRATRGFERRFRPVANSRWFRLYATPACLRAAGRRPVS